MSEGNVWPEYAYQCLIFILFVGIWNENSFQIWNAIWYFPYIKFNHKSFETFLIYSGFIRASMFCIINGFCYKFYWDYTTMTQHCMSLWSINDFRKYIYVWNRCFFTVNAQALQIVLVKINMTLNPFLSRSFH